jgi:hypothetical protein
MGKLGEGYMKILLFLRLLESKIISKSRVKKRNMRYHYTPIKSCQTPEIWNKDAKQLELSSIAGRNGK